MFYFYLKIIFDYKSIADTIFFSHMVYTLLLEVS